MSVFRTLYSNLIELPAKAALRGLGTMRALFATAATTMVVVATSIGALVCRRNREQGGDSRAEPLLKEAQESSVGVGKGPTGVAHASPATIAQHSAQDIAGAGLRKHAVDSHTAGSASTSGQVSQGNEAVQSPEQVHLQLPIDVTGSNNLSNAAYTEDSAASASFSKAQGGVGDPVDMNHLQSLLETEGFGQSKFADLQGRMQSSTAEPRQRASVEDLFASELGPVNSRFAKPKTSAQLQAHASASGKGSSSANTQGLGKRTAADAALAGVSVLVLSITHGPAAGTVFVADDGSKEYKLGRNPQCEFQLLDQEVSSRHAILDWSIAERHWQLHDAGSLNGTLLNGITISTEYGKAGTKHVLQQGDCLEFGSLSRLNVLLEGPEHALALAAKRQHTGAAAQTSQRAAVLQGSTAPQLYSEAVGTVRIPQAELPPLLVNRLVPELGLTIVAHSKLGSDHKRMEQGCEDVLHWESPMVTPFTHGGLFCVFDGHQGVRAAAAAKEQLPGILLSKLLAQGAQTPPGTIIGTRPHSEQASLLRDTFLEMDKAITIDEGCTASVLLLERSRSGSGAGTTSWLVQTANVGDSSAVLVDTAGRRVVKLTADHRIASSSAERERLAQRGHSVRSRLYGLNISRMLGDRFLKDEDLGFLADPHVSEATQVVQQVPATAAGEGQQAGSSAAGAAGGMSPSYIIMASDGLWDVVPEDKAGQTILHEVLSGNPPSAEGIANSLMMEALSLRSKDDISIIVLELHGREH